jgi:hypothetical protein
VEPGGAWPPCGGKVKIGEKVRKWNEIEQEKEK